MARIHNYIGRETVLKRKWLDIMIDSELVEESQGMASTRRKLVVNRLWTDNTIGSGIVPYRIRHSPTSFTIQAHTVTTSNRDCQTSRCGALV